MQVAPGPGITAIGLGKRQELARIALHPRFQNIEKVVRDHLRQYDESLLKQFVVVIHSAPLSWTAVTSNR